MAYFQLVVAERVGFVPDELAPLNDLAAIAIARIRHGRVVPRLNSLVYQQTVTSAERSVIELWLDIKLLHQNLLADGPERLFALRISPTA